jgi:hypothetical protein
MHSLHLCGIEKWTPPACHDRYCVDGRVQKSSVVPQWTTSESMKFDHAFDVGNRSKEKSKVLRPYEHESSMSPISSHSLELQSGRP